LAQDWLAPFFYEKTQKKTTEIAYCYYSLVIVVDSQIKTPTFWRQICYVPHFVYIFSVFLPTTTTARAALITRNS
jgi:hypothetical protein